MFDPLMQSLMCEAVEDSVVDTAIDNGNPAIASTPETATAIAGAVADSEDIPDEEDLVDAPEVADDINSFLDDDERIPGVPKNADMPDNDIELDGLDDPVEEDNEDEPDTVSTGGDDGATVVGPEIPERIEVTDPDNDLPDWAKAIQSSLKDKVEPAPTTLEQVVTNEDRLMACKSLDEFLTLDRHFGKTIIDIPGEKFDQTTANPEEVNAEDQSVFSSEDEFITKDHEVRSELNDSRN